MNVSDLGMCQQGLSPGAVFVRVGMYWGRVCVKLGVSRGAVIVRGKTQWGAFSIIQTCSFQPLLQTSLK